MKKIIYLVIALILISNVFGELEISQVVYDAEGADEGQEFIEIFNSYNESINLDTYSLEYNSGENWEEIWTGDSSLMKSNSFYIIGEINESNYYVELNMLNTRGAVRLLKEGVEIDLLGYGESLIYLGLPAVDVASGKSLLRVDSTGYNFADFVESDILIRNYNEDVVKINVLNSIPEVNNYSSVFVSDISKLSLEVTDLNGLDDLTKVEVNCSNELVNLSYNSTIGVNCVEDYSFRVWDLAEATEWFSVSNLEMFEIGDISGCNAIPGSNCLIEVEAKANVDLELNLSISSLIKGSSSIDVNSLKSLTFNSGETKAVSFEFTLPTGISAGEYKGDLIIEVK